MKEFKADMHIHTVLSPCASDEMTPCAIVNTALAIGLDIIAVTDHNSAKNALSVILAAAPYPLAVIPGIEIETSESVHLVALFPNNDIALTASEKIRSFLPAIDPAYTAHYGEQILLGPDDSYTGKETVMLAKPSNLDIASAVQLIGSLGGLSIAAHVERPSYSVYSRFGDIPRDIPFDALEVSPTGKKPIGLREKFARYGWPLVSSSDSHYLGDIGKVFTKFCMEKPDFEDIRLALAGVGGRSVSIA